MFKDVLYSVKSPYREEMKIYGYYFGVTGKQLENNNLENIEKSACIVGAMRGNEIQQLFICSQLIRTLEELERKGCIIKGKQILVVPSVNHYSMNIEKRFWPIDNTDINRMFPGYSEGETTQRIAAGLFEKVHGYSYGIHFASFYMPGDFVSHIRMMETKFHNPSLANLFGLPYVVIRKPKPYDTTTLNYNWQLWETNAFSLYTKETDEIDIASANQAVSAVLRFLTRMGIIRYNCHGGYISTVIQEEELMTIKSDSAGIYKRYHEPGDEVHMGDILAEIIHPLEGYTISRILSPVDGVIFFAHKSPLVMENAIVYRLIKRFYM